MIELVIYIILVNIIFELLLILCPMSKLNGFLRSFLSLLIIYLIVLKVKSFL